MAPLAVNETVLWTQERDELVAAGQRLTAQGLVIGTGGNLSTRCGEHVLVSPTGATLGDLTPSMLTLVGLDGAVVDGELAPTSELPLHLAIYRNTDARAVAHAHASACIAVSNAHDELPAVHYTAVALGDRCGWLPTPPTAPMRWQTGYSGHWTAGWLR